jgi:hypothetical protein
MKINLLIIIIFIASLGSFAQNAFAANISFSLPTEMKVGENLDVIINADTGGILVNSIELVINYDESSLSFSGYSDDNAVIKLWIEPPHAEAGKIYLSGIVPGGVLGLYDPNKKGLSPVPLVNLFFVGKKTGDAKFSFDASKILKNDGEGTALAHEELSGSVMINNNPNSKNPDIAKQEIISFL